MPSGHLSILVKFLLSQKNRTEAVEIDHVKTLDNAEGDTYGDLPRAYHTQSCIHLFTEAYFKN